MSSFPQDHQPAKRSLLQQLSDAQAGVAAGALASVVAISNGGRSGAAGVIWSADGLIITNAHVVKSRTPLVELSDGRQMTAQVVAIDRGHDLACLQIEADQLLPVARRSSAELRPGDWIVALGHPWGVRGAASAGSVIAVGRPAEMGPAGGEPFVQVGVHLRPGHSGGPMINAAGELVGLNTMMAGPQVGLAVPIATIEKFMNSLGDEEDSDFI